MEKHPGEVSPEDVKRWQRRLEERLRPATVYVRVSLLSSFYEWLMRDPVLARFIQTNPVRLARPRAPKPYQTESVKSFTDEELIALVEHVRALAAEDSNLVAKRDYALLRLYVATGWRREEVISLRGSDVRVADGLIVSGRAKGGHYRAKEVRDPEVKDALLDYLAAAGTAARAQDGRARSGRVTTTRSSPASSSPPTPSSESEAVRARGGIRRCTPAPDTAHFRPDGLRGDGLDLGHAGCARPPNRATTSHYVQRIAVKRDLTARASQSG